MMKSSHGMGLLWITLLSFLPFASAAVTCLDQNGSPVDWFVVYKLPKIRDPKHQAVENGLGQIYMDNKSKKWTLLDQPISGTNHAIYYTLNQIYKNSKSKTVMYALYNDQINGGSASSRGHTKGDVCFDKTSGFWLIHSVPNFPPPANQKYNYPETGMRNGQTFLCVSLPYSYLNTIGKQLLFNYPQIYNGSLPATFAKENVNVVKAMNREQTKGPSWSNRETLKSIGGQTFVSFAKARKFNQDLYQDLVAPSLKSNLLVSTWLNGAATDVPSNCSQTYSVKNVKSVNILGFEFNNSQDHSKWVVSGTNRLKKLEKFPNLYFKPKWTCIGDINRQTSQFSRGGGTLCSDIPAMWNGFSKAVASIENCSKRRRNAKRRRNENY